MKYEVRISDGFGDPDVTIVNTPSGFVRAVQMALDSHYNEEDKVSVITCRRVKE